MVGCVCARSGEDDKALEHFEYIATREQVSKWSDTANVHPFMGARLLDKSQRASIYGKCMRTDMANVHPFMGAR